MYYAGPTEPVTAAKVVKGDLLVHDKAPAGYLAVTDTRDEDGQVALWFDSGESVTYPPGQPLHRVA